MVKSSNLKPLRASKNYITSTMDEYPILFVMSALIKGKSYFYNLSSLKNKESNRVLEMQKILKQIGIYSKLNKNKLFIIGKNIHTIALNKVKVNNVFDHRIAMASAILALLTGVKIVINGFDTVKTSSPNFLKIIKTLGGKFEKKKN